MYLVVGLGNPGPRYEDHRHNAGFMVLGAVARRAGATFQSSRYDGLFVRTSVGGQTTGLLLPQTYMNLSGDSVAPAARFFKVPPEQILVVHDELDLPFGTLRLKAGGGLAGHNGLKSIAQCLGTRDFLRLRFGVGRPTPPLDAAAHVLTDFSPEEGRTLDDHLGKAADAVSLVLEEGLKAAMGRIHIREKPPKKKKEGPGKADSEASGPSDGSSASASIGPDPSGDPKGS